MRDAQNPPRFRAAIFFRAVFLRVAHDGLGERWATSSLFYLALEPETNSLLTILPYFTTRNEL